MEATNATAEVNAFRAAKGLPPFEEDACLVEAAKTIALERALERRAGHTRNDFSGLPEGCRADAAGCAAWPPESGWGSCCDSEAWKYAGAAFVLGDDGRRYMQLFVRESAHPRRWMASMDRREHHPIDTECLGK